MSGYSDEEITAVASKFVRSDVKVQRDILGPIDVGAKFDEVQQFISSTLIFDPNAIFYLIYLATNQLNKDVEVLIDWVDDLLQVVQEVSLATKDVTRTSLLGDAAASLLTVDQILTDQGAISSSAFSRYQRSVDQFISASVAPNIRNQGEIVRPPQLARKEAPTILTDINTMYQSILATLSRTQDMLSEFLGLNLPVVAAQESIRTTRIDVKDLQQYFEGSATRDDKIAKCREAYLRLTTGKSVLETYTAVVDPSDPRMAASADRLGKAAVLDLVPAEVSTGRSAPWSIDSGTNQLVLRHDGSLSWTNYTLVPPTQPNLTGYQVEPFTINSLPNASLTSSNPQNYSVSAPNNVAAFFVGGVKYEGTISPGTYTGAQMAAALGAIPGGSGVMSDVATVGYTTGVYIVSALGLAVGDGSINSTLGFAYGQVSNPTPVNNSLEIDGLVPLVTFGDGVRSASDIAGTINMWASTFYPGQYLSQGVAGQVKITKTLAGAQTLKITGGSSLSTLGFFAGQSDTAEAMSAAELAAIINAGGEAEAETFVVTFEMGLNADNDTLGRLRVPLNYISDLNHAGDQLLIRNGPNAGYHRISSIVRSAPYDIINVSDPFVEITDGQEWRIVREGVKIRSKASDLSTKVEVGSGSAHTELGMTTGVTYGQTEGFSANESGSTVDFAPYKVAAEDLLVMGSTYTVVELVSSTLLRVDPMLATNVVGQTFSIISAAAEAYKAFIAATEDWTELQQASSFREDTLELDRVMNPLLANKNPSLAQRQDATSRIQELKSLLTGSSPQGLTQVLVGFEVNSSSRMDASLKMLRERGMDRAYDTLMDGKVAEFFGMDKDDVSNSSYMLKTMRAIAQYDLPITKETDELDDQALYQSTEDSDPDFDYGDMDHDETTKELSNAFINSSDLGKQRL